MILWLYLMAGAWAQGTNALTVEVRDPQHLVRPPLAAELAAREATLPLNLRDDGLPPDRRAGDGVFTASLAAPRAPTAELRLWDATQRWEGSAGFSDEETQTLRVTLGQGGQLRIAGSASSTPGVQRHATAGTLGSASLLATLPWLMAAAGFGAALLLLWRRESRVRPRPAPRAPAGAPTGPLRVRPGALGVVGLIDALARRGPVLVVGPLPSGSWPEGAVTVLDDPLPRVGDVVAAWGEIAGAPPPALLLTGPVEALEGPGEAALDEISQLLPGVPLLIPDPDGPWEISPDGRPTRGAPRRESDPG